MALTRPCKPIIIWEMKRMHFVLTPLCILSLLVNFLDYVHTDVPVKELFVSRLGPMTLWLHLLLTVGFFRFSFEVITKAFRASIWVNILGWHPHNFLRASQAMAFLAILTGASPICCMQLRGWHIEQTLEIGGDYHAKTKFLRWINYDYKSVCATYNPLRKRQGLRLCRDFASDVDSF